MMTPQQLKNSILQRAIEGKLVEQRPEEGTAKELIDMIDRYNGNIKPIKEDLDYSSMDFDIPDTWEWVELNRTLKFVDYRGKTPTKISSGVFLVTASNIKNGYMDYTRKEYISEQEYNTRLERGVTEKGDVLFTTEAPMGNCALNDLEKCSCGQRIITLKNYKKDAVDLRLIMYFLLSPPFQRELLDNCTGTTAKGIKAAKLKHFLIPLPPLPEQHRIVAKIEDLLPLVDEYDKAYSQLAALNEKFPADMKKSILQYAIEGKLVEQRPEEGTAKDLLKQIKAEKDRLIKEGKIKKTKPLLPITEDEIPFEIPESWEWVRLQDFCFPVRYGTSSKSDKVGKVPVLRMGNIQLDGEISYDDLVYSNDEVDIEKYLLEKNDLLFNRTNSRELVGKTAIYRGDIPAIFAGYLIQIKTIVVNSFFLRYVMNSEYERDYCKSVKSDGINQSNVNGQKLANFCVPIPPLSEQHRIVAKLEQIWFYIDKIHCKR